MSIKTTQRIALGVIASLVFAPIAAIAPASAVDLGDTTEITGITTSRDSVDLNVNVTQTITAAVTFADLEATDDFTIKSTIITQPGTGSINVTATGSGNITPETGGEAMSTVRSSGAIASVEVTNPAASANDSKVLSTAFSFVPTLAGTYTMRVWHDQNADNALSAGEKFSTLELTVTQAPGATNRAVNVVEATASTTKVVGTAINVNVDGLAAVSGIGIGDTVTYTAAINSPTGSDVALDDNDGSRSAATNDMWNNNATDFTIAAGSPSNDGALITLVSDTVKSANSDLNLGRFTFTPDVVGTYVMTFRSTDANGAVTGSAVTLSIAVTAPAVNSLVNQATSYTLAMAGDNTLADIRSNDGVCYADVNSSKKVNYIEAIYRLLFTNVFYLEILAELDDIDNAAGESNGKLVATITGPGIWTDINADGSPVFDISSNFRVLTIDGDELSEIGNGDAFEFNITGAGKVVISLQEVMDSGVTRSVGTYTVLTGADCTGKSYDAAESGVSVKSNAIALTAKPVADVPGSNNVLAGGTGFIAVYLADSNGELISDPDNVLSASSSAAVTLGWDGVGTVNGALIRGTDVADAVLHVRTATANAALSATIEIRLNNEVIATKTLNFAGVASKIAISGKKLSVSTSASTVAFKYALSDAADNRVTGTVTATVDGTYVTAATVGASSATAASDVTVICSALRGKESVTLSYGTGGALKETVEVICAGGIASFEVTTNKAAYERGEIGVLTISAKDLAGNPVPDGTDLATAASKIQFTGTGATFAKGTAPVVFTDEFADGKIDYAFTASTTAGSYSYALWHADLSPAVTKSAAFTVNAPVVAPSYTKPTLTASLDGGRVLLFGACEADEGDMIVYVKRPGGAWNEKAKTLECVAGEFDGSVIAPKKYPKYYRVKQEGTGLWSGSVLVRP